jgi:hypothetical protein
MAFQRFLELAMPVDQDARLFDPKIIYIPGNHDHHLWESAREVQYAKHLEKTSARQFVGPPWHRTRMFRVEGVPSTFANAVVARCPWLQDVSVATLYPNFGISKGRKAVIFTHGHFTEAIYSLMTRLADAMFPGRRHPGTIQDWEAENFAWIDFFWSTLGRSGLVGTEAELVYEMMQEPKKLAAFAGNAARSVLREHGGGLGRHFGWVLAPLVRSVLTGRLERAQPGKVLSDDGAGLRKFLEGPLRGQLEEELGDALPEEITVVFGHTHKPFEEVLTLEDFTRPRIRVYNSGGWVVDRKEPQPLYGGAVVLVDDDLDTASLRMYNESKSPSDYAVSLGAAGPLTAAPSPFLAQLQGAVRPESAPWRDFSACAAAAVAAHTRTLAAALARVP